MRIAALTDHIHTPSSRFRIRSHIPFLSRHNIFVTDLQRKFSTESAGDLFPNRRTRHSPLKLFTSLAFESLNIVDSFSRSLKTNLYDATWISRQLIIGYPSFERLLKKPLFFDIDDAVFLSRTAQPGIHCLMRNATAIFAGNSFLAEYCSDFNANVYVIPTAVDVSRFAPSLQKRSFKQMTIGWSGTSSSYKFFYPIADALSKFLLGKPDVRLKFFSDRFPSELKQLHPYLDFEYWSPNLEADQIRSLDIGLMPIENSDWSRGKCAYKMLLYASTGLPTLCSSYGMNMELVSQYDIGLSAESPSEWRDNLNSATVIGTAFNQFSQLSSTVVDHFSHAVIQEKLLRIFSAHGLVNQ